MDWEECIKNNIVKQVSTDKKITDSIMDDSSGSLMYSFKKAP